MDGRWDDVTSGPEKFSNDTSESFSNNASNYRNKGGAENRGENSRDRYQNRNDFSRPPTRGGMRGKSNYRGSDENRQPSSHGFRDERSFDQKKRQPITYEPVDQFEDDEMIFKMGISSGIDFDAYDDIPVEVTGGSHSYVPCEKFTDCHEIIPEIMNNIRKSGYNKPTPIQRHTLPIMLKNQCDVMACSQTGSGKTAAFIIPIFSRLMEAGSQIFHPQSVPTPSLVVLGPTRELVCQIWTEMRKFAISSPIRCAVVYGGVSKNYLLRQLNMGCHAIAATPGRLIQFINEGLMDLTQVRYLVLDEADRMLDMGFIDPIKRIVNLFGMPGVGKRRTCMCSATFPVEIQKLAKEMLVNDYFFIAVGSVGSAASTIIQKVELMPIMEKRKRLLQILDENIGKKVLVFVQTKRTADYLATFLLQSDVSATSIHGDRTQEQRERALSDFKSGTHAVLLATGVAARGLDIPNVEIVLNYDMPNEMDEYVHRIGRTGRVGNHGLAISFLQIGRDENVMKELSRILSESNQEVPEWLQESVANVGRGTSFQYGTTGGRSQFASRDTRYPQQKPQNFVKHTEDQNAFEDLDVIRSTFPQANSWSDSHGQPYEEESWE